MRAALMAWVSWAALGLGCVYEPVDIARFEAGEDNLQDTFDDASAGSQHVEWSETQLRAGVVLLAYLGMLDVEMLAAGEGPHHVVIELLPISPATFPAGFTASLDRVDAEPIESGRSGQGDDTFQPFGAGLRYEGELQLGWLLSLHADETSEVEVRARIIEP
jgi:hypothetical protein